MTTMAPDTKDAVLGINIKVLGGIMTILMMAVLTIMWFARLEFVTKANEQDIIRMSLDINSVRVERQRDNDRITRAESQLQFILQGIDEIKDILKEKRQ